MQPGEGDVLRKGPISVSSPATYGVETPDAPRAKDADRLEGRPSPGRASDKAGTSAACRLARFLSCIFVESVTQWSSDPTEINSTAMRHVVKR